MKKSIIAAGAASVALAAMPIVGAFAAVTDNLTAYVGNGCNISSDARTDTATFGSSTTGLTPGADDTQTTGAIKFTCNAGWTMSITPGQLTGTGTAIKGTEANAKGSYYQLKLVKTGEDAITNAYADSFVYVSSAVTGSAAVTDLILTPSYKLHVGEAQEPGTYSGTVTYNIGITGTGA